MTRVAGRAARLPGGDQLRPTSKMYSRRQLWSLFLMAALPVHIWTFIRIFADFGWIAERTNAWDAVAVAAYGLLAALIESLAVLGFTALLGVLVPARWGSDTRVLLMGTLAALTAAWAVFGQVYFYAHVQIPAWVYRVVLLSPRPLWALHLLAGSTVAATLLPAVWLIPRYDRVRSAMAALFDRLGLLMTVYLVFDLAALLVVILRNVL